jgi:RNA polymerase sigma factor (sigma-70 family)
MESTLSRRIPRLVQAYAQLATPAVDDVTVPTPVRSGDDRLVLTVESLAAAFDQHGRGIYGYCLRRIGSVEDAEDLLSVVFLEAWRSRSRAFVIEGTLAPWLYGIARNLLRSNRRAMRRHRAALDRYHSNDRDAHQSDPADTVVAAADAAHARGALGDALDRLSTKDREVARLCLVGDLSAGQAAVVLGIPEGTAKSRLAHARSSLKRLLHSSDLVPGSDPEAGSGHVPGGRAPHVRTATVRDA